LISLETLQRARRDQYPDPMTEGIGRALSHS
jgi:hypothetical protein